jgi:hypothetical protein
MGAFRRWRGVKRFPPLRRQKLVEESFRRWRGVNTWMDFFWHQHAGEPPNKSL